MKDRMTLGQFLQLQVVVSACLIVGLFTALLLASIWNPLKWLVLPWEGYWLYVGAWAAFHVRL